ncbi:hypothetical protein [Kurthia sibirica]|uniref:Cytochrome-c oxidase n=1 Tax=Kurthia sibirica TaxID=202750 RepID=A0A2U3AKV5_9BACL|nr:hypothetical protein [Kurthia sibirica]PWI25177.1 hypothetical protein DEX24_09580 [Kurthia sibirica]GEK33264.1 hypothetical protein KSI01_07970 [Kurthia sibirica]
MKNFSALWVKISMIYFLVGLTFGVYMHLTIQLQWKATHAHILVVGWLTTVVIGLIYARYEEAATHLLARLSFWFYHIGLPFLLLGMYSIYSKPLRPYMRIFVDGGGTVFIIGILLVTVNLFMHAKDHQET